MSSNNEDAGKADTAAEKESLEENLGGIHPEEDEEEDFDETLSERLWGLTEMFPNWFQSGVSTLTSGSASTAKFLYAFSRNALWIFFSSATILVAPAIFEVERAQMEEMHKQQQRQILLGPNAAIAGSQPHFPMPIPPAPPQQSR